MQQLFRPILAAGKKAPGRLARVFLFLMGVTLMTGNRPEHRRNQMHRLAWHQSRDNILLFHHFATPAPQLCEGRGPQTAKYAE